PAPALEFDVASLRSTGRPASTGTPLGAHRGCHTRVQGAGRRTTNSALTELGQLVVEGAPADAEQARGLGAVAVGAGEGVGDGGALGLVAPGLEGVARRRRGRGRRRAPCALEVARELALDLGGADPVGLGEDDEPLDEVGELAHVAGPALLREQLDRVGVDRYVVSSVLLAELAREALRSEERRVGKECRSRG